MSLARHPRCNAYLAAQRINLNDPAIDAWTAAALVAESFTDKDLTRWGGVNFWTMDGDQCLDAMEAFLQQRISKPKLERLKAVLGAQGIKTGKLRDDDAFWSAARRLWPDNIRQEEGATLADLLAQIDAMPKAYRRRVARQNRNSGSTEAAE